MTEITNYEEDSSWFVIGGCFRSGNTLMRLCLNSHPSIVCFDEKLGYDFIDGKNKERLTALTEHTPFVGFKVPARTLCVEQLWSRWSSQLAGPLSRRTPGGIIFLLRDPRAVVASMLKLARGQDPTFFELFWRRQLAQEDSVAGNHRSAFADVMQRAENRNAALAALTWAATWDVFERIHSTSQLNTIPVVYENFVSSPERVLRQVLGFLKVNWQPSVLQHHLADHGNAEIIHYQREGIFSGFDRFAPGRNPLDKAITVDSISLWQNDLSVGELQIVMDVVGDRFGAFESLKGKHHGTSENCS